MKVKKLSILKLSLLSGILSSLLISCGQDIDQSQLLLNQIQNSDNSTATIQASKAKDNTQTKASVEHAVFMATVTKILPDDTSGLKHEQFMVQITSDRFKSEVIRVAHDTNYAPYVPVKVGSQLEIKGDMITNANPKVLHWTHHCEIREGVKSHPDGYIKLEGKIYQ